jgi:hypothetical protein
MSLWSTKRGRQELFHARTETNQINHNERWLLVGDFNLIYRANDKSSGPINRRLLTSFKSLLVDLEVKEIHLHGRCYTWSSGTANPTQTKIDHVFATRDWEMLYPDYHLQTGGIEVSDHCPMVLSYSPFHKRYKGFRFEACWLLMPDFKERVAQSWSASVSSTNKARVIHLKLSRLAKALKRWSREKSRAPRQDSIEAQQPILQLEQLQDQRYLMDNKLQGKQKTKILGLAVGIENQTEVKNRSAVV